MPAGQHTTVLRATDAAHAASADREGDQGSGVCSCMDDEAGLCGRVVVYI